MENGHKTCSIDVSHLVSDPITIIGGSNIYHIWVCIHEYKKFPTLLNLDHPGTSINMT